MKLIAAMFLLAGLATAQTNTSFYGARNYLGFSPAIADFNHDGILDLATLDVSTGNVRIHAGIGNGTFGGDEIVTLPTQINGDTVLLTADLNGDGLPDLIVGQGSSVLVFLGTASGGFSSSGTYSIGSGVNLFLKDLNGDGKLDLIAIGGSGITVLLGNGDGTFGHSTTVVTLQGGGYSLAIADFNGDGAEDLATPVTGGVLILFGDGTGKFPTGTSFTTVESFGVAAAADLNGDGKQDLVLESGGKGLLEVLLGNGNGTFAAPQIYVVSGSNAGPTYSLAIGDVNGDGIPDIATPDPAVLIGKGDGTFAAPVLYPGNPFIFGVQLADIRNIGKLDIIANGDIDSTTVLLNSSQGKFEDGPVVRLNKVGSCIAVADFNRDGHDDAAVSAGGSVEILLGTGERTSALQRSSALSIQSPNGACPIAGDFNNDGIPDLLVNLGNKDVDFLPGNGDGTFGTPVVTVSTSVLGQIVSGDFNGDGVLDTAALVKGPTTQIQLLFGNGAGHFSAPISLSAQNNLKFIVAADLNGDGVTDLVAIAQGTPVITIFLSAGGGSFKSQIIDLPQSASYAQIADVNRDGIPDLVVFGSTYIYIYFGVGDGTFNYTTEVAAAGGSGLITDFNGDGIPDLAVDDGTEVKLFLGDGTGAFAYPGNPDGLWFAIAGSGTTLAAANLQSQTKAAGLSDLITLGIYPGIGYVGELLNQGLAH